MGVYASRYKWDWKPIAGSVQSEEKICPRCKNHVRYFLAYDGDGYGFPGIWTFKLKQHYAFKCPVCPNFESVEKREAKSIIWNAQHGSN